MLVKYCCRLYNSKFVYFLNASFLFYNIYIYILTLSTKILEYLFAVMIRCLLRTFQPKSKA